MLGHYSAKQTEEYAITEQEAIRREMEKLESTLKNKSDSSVENIKALLLDLKKNGSYKDFRRNVKRRKWI